MALPVAVGHTAFSVLPWFPGVPGPHAQGPTGSPLPRAGSSPGGTASLTHLLDTWQGARGQRIPRLLRFSGALLCTVNLPATTTLRCPPGPVSQLFPWTLSSVSGAVLCPPHSTYVLGGPHPPPPEQSRSWSCHLQVAGTLAQLCALPPPKPQEEGSSGGRWPPDPILTGTPEALPPTVAFLFGLRQQRPEGKGQRSGQAPPPSQGLPMQIWFAGAGGNPPRSCPKTPIPLLQLTHLSGGPAPLWEGTDLGQCLLRKLSSSLGRLPSGWVTWTPSRPEHHGRSRRPFLDLSGWEEGHPC